MKTSNAFGLVLASMMVLAGCEKADPAADVAAPAAQEEAAPAQAVAPIIALDEVEQQLSEPALASVDVLGSVVLPESGSVIQVTGDTVSIAGFAVDKVNVKPAAGVVVMIDGQPYVASYGGERQDIATALGSPEFLKSQFFVEIPTAGLVNGMHDVTLRVVSADRSGYYASDWNAKISVSK